MHTDNGGLCFEAVAARRVGSREAARRRNGGGHACAAAGEQQFDLGNGGEERVGVQRTARERAPAGTAERDAADRFLNEGERLMRQEARTRKAVRSMELE